MVACCPQFPSLSMVNGDIVLVLTIVTPLLLSCSWNYICNRWREQQVLLPSTLLRRSFPFEIEIVPDIHYKGVWHHTIIVLMFPILHHVAQSTCCQYGPLKAESWIVLSMSAMMRSR
ncbi:hypothetical protein ABZP36_000961 [Zizania latifolia]